MASLRCFVPSSYPLHHSSFTLLSSLPLHHSHSHLQHFAPRLSTASYHLRQSRVSPFQIHACCSDSDADIKQDGLHKHEDDCCQQMSMVPWGSELTAATMVTYYGVLHIPLSIGGLSLVSATFHIEMVESQTKAIFLFLLQLTELIAAVGLIESTLQPFHFGSIWLAFNVHDFLQKRLNMLATFAGLGGLFLVMASVSAISYSFLHGEGGESKQYLHEILFGSSISMGCTFLTYCLITPLLEEYMYRGFLLTSLRAYMPPLSAIVLSAALFSMAHFSLSDSIYFFFIGSILGMTFHVTGNLVPSFLIHSGYNFVVLMSVLLQG